MRPSQVTDFATLYGRNCAGCHGSEGRPGAAVSLADPVYLALADDATIRRIAADGVQGTAMPAFAQSGGGTLTDEQIDILVAGMRARWGHGGALGSAAAPPYASAPGDARRGAEAYATHCANCHGASGAGGAHGASIVDGSYLGLVSDQGLRTAVLVGRPALGMPDWRGDGKGSPMTAEEVADVVAWLVAKRPPFPGQPYPIKGEHNG
jgi:mono/diheme cytochrome c family protein